MLQLRTPHRTQMCQCISKKKIEGSLASWRLCLAQRPVILDGDRSPRGLACTQDPHTSPRAPKLMGEALSSFAGTRRALQAGPEDRELSPASCNPVCFGGSFFLSLSLSYVPYKIGVILPFSSVYIQKIVRIIKRNKEGKNSLWQEQSHCCSIWPRTGIFLQRIHPNGAQCLL